LFSLFVFINEKLTIEDRRKRFPFLDYSILPSLTRKIGLSTIYFEPKNIQKILQEQLNSLDKESVKYKILKNWMNNTQSELNDLYKYPLDDVKRILFIYNHQCIFYFYLIYDNHFDDPQETVFIDLKHSEGNSLYTNLMSSLGILFSFSSLVILFYSS
jgi:hypothetical protein